MGLHIKFDGPVLKFDKKNHVCYQLGGLDSVKPSANIAKANLLI